MVAFITGRLSGKFPTSRRFKWSDCHCSVDISDSLPVNTKKCFSALFLFFLGGGGLIQPVKIFSFQNP